MSKRLEPRLPLITDPYIDAVFGHVKLCQQMLDDANPEPSEEMSHKMVEELDARWPHMEKTVRVTGYVRGSVLQLPDDSSQSDVFEDEPAYIRHWVEDQPFVSRGFCGYTELLKVDEHEIGRRIILGLLMVRDVAVFDAAGQAINVIQHRFVDPTEFSHIEYPDMSTDGRDAFIRETNPRAYAALEEISVKHDPILDARLMALKNVPLDEFPHLSEAHMRWFGDLASDAVGVHYDTVPLQLTLRPNCLLFDGHDPELPVGNLNDTKILATITGIAMTPKYRLRMGPEEIFMSPRKHKFQLMAQMIILGKKLSGDMGVFAVRMNDILDARSVRRIMNE